MSAQVKIGDILSNYELTDIHRSPSTIDKEMGSNGMLLFVLRGTWCPFCVHQIMATRARINKYTSRGVNVAFIIPEEDAKVAAFALTTSRQLPFGLHADEDAQLTDLLVGDVKGNETRKVGIYLINTDREIKWQFVGWDDEYPATTTVLNAIEEHVVPAINQSA